MRPEEFSDEEWQEILDEVRLLVQRAGYADWDKDADQAFDEGTEDEPGTLDRDFEQPAHEQLRQYVSQFIQFLKARSRWTLDERRRSLGNLLHTPDGGTITDFKVIVGGRERSLYERTEETDAMIDELRRFLDEISGESTSFWDGSPEGPDGVR